MNDIYKSPVSKLEEESEKQTALKIYWKYWRRGWWSWLLMFLSNIALLPILLASQSLVYDETKFYLVVTVVSLIILLPTMGWLFEFFAKHSKRI